jgi:hypothetical protein
LTILITADGEYLAEDDSPVVGHRYTLEDATCGTSAQNKAFHSILTEYWKSGLWSYQGSGYKQGATFDEFRDMVKRNLGAGFESYIYATDKGIKKAKTLEEIPTEYRSDKRFILGKLKSWSSYGKKERKQTIDNLIAECNQVGLNS